VFHVEPFTLNPKGTRPMDMRAMKRDLAIVLETLPTDLVTSLLGTAFQHVPEIQRVVPALAPLIMPHVMAGMVEHSCGALDKEEIGAAVKKVFAEYLASRKAPATEAP
jgi:hypothetical protein